MEYGAGMFVGAVLTVGGIVLAAMVANWYEEHIGCLKKRLERLEELQSDSQGEKEGEHEEQGGASEAPGGYL